MAALQESGEESTSEAEASDRLDEGGGTGRCGRSSTGGSRRCTAARGPGRGRARAGLRRRASLRGAGTRTGARAGTTSTGRSGGDSGVAAGGHGSEAGASTAGTNRASDSRNGSDGRDTVGASRAGSYRRLRSDHTRLRCGLGKHRSGHSSNDAEAVGLGEVGGEAVGLVAADQ